MMTFGIGVNGSIETSAPFSTRGEPGNVVMAPQILLCVRSSFSCRQPFFGKFEPETVEGVADFPARIGLAVLDDIFDVVVDAGLEFRRPELPIVFDPADGVIEDLLKLGDLVESAFEQHARISNFGLAGAGGRAGIFRS